MPDLAFYVDVLDELLDLRGLEQQSVVNIVEGGGATHSLPRRGAWVSGRGYRASRMGRV